VIGRNCQVLDKLVEQYKTLYPKLDRALWELENVTVVIRYAYGRQLSVVVPL